VGNKENNIYNNIYKGLDITKVINYKLKDLIIPPRPTKVKISIKKGQNFSRKRLFSYINTLLPPSKYMYSGFLPKNKRYLITLNQVHQHVITRDYKKPLYKTNSWAAILTTLKGGIKGYKSLYTQAGII
jgi:hypothetical protein